MKSQEYLDRLAVRTSLDCGGYTWDNPEPTSPLAELGAVTTDGDTEYFIGGDAIPRKHRFVDMGFLAFVENDGHYPMTVFPETLPCDEDGIYDRLVVGAEGEGDRDCSWCGDGTGNESCRPTCAHGNVKPTGAAGDEYPEHCRLACKRCDGDGYVDCPGGDWAWYGYQRNPEEED